MPAPSSNLGPEIALAAQPAEISGAGCRSEVLDPEEVWLFGSRARETHGPDSDWDFMAVLPDTAPEERLDLAAVWVRCASCAGSGSRSFPSGAVTSMKTATSPASSPKQSRARAGSFMVADAKRKKALAKLLQAASLDLDAARRLLARSSDVLAANHLQQAAEKIISAVRLHRGLINTKDHDLVILVDGRLAVSRVRCPQAIHGASASGPWNRSPRTRRRSGTASARHPRSSTSETRSSP